MTAPLGIDGVLAGRYALVEVIGRGRSVVYRARDTRLGRDVAVKQVELVQGPSTGGVDDVRSRALREARASARITSPFVVGVFDVVEESAAVWLVMELVRAPSLAQLVGDQGPLAERRAAHIGLGVLDALDAAHAEGIVHRDVKPGNVLVGDQDGVPDDGGDADVPVKLADFGVAALRDETSLTSPGAVIGSPSFMAPEQATGRPVGPAADLWALGALLYFAVEGQPPFLADSALATATAVVHAEPRPQERPGRLSGVIAMLLDKSPDHRPDARRVRAILRSTVGGSGSDGDSGEVTGPLAAGRPTAGDAPADSTEVLASGPAAGDGGGRTAATRRLAWGSAALVVVVAAAALQFTGSGDSPPAADPDRTEVRPSGAGDPTTTVDETGERGGAPRSADTGGPAAPPRSDDAEPEAPAAPAGPDGSTTSTAPPDPTTTLPAVTTTTAPPGPDVTTPSTTAPDPTASTTAPSVPPGDDDAGA